MVTIKQLARMAGVSPTTVVNVLHGRVYKMKDETLQKVKRIIEETKYVPNMGGRLLANYGSRIIGVIISHEKRDSRNVTRGPFFSEIIGSLEASIRKNGYYMMLYAAANVEESLLMAGAWNLEGLIVLGCHMEECRQFLNNTSLPLVFIDSYFPDDNLPYACVGLEDRKGGYLMTRYLIEKGHKNICFLSVGNPERGVFYERYCGFRQAMEEERLPVQKSDYLSLPYEPDRVLDFYRDFMSGPIRNYTALFFALDLAALHAISLFQRNGIQVPEHISVSGFDGNIFSSLFNPSLTTIQQNVSEKAEQAANMLIHLIRKEEPAQRIIRQNVSITEGNSVKDIR